MKEKTEVEYVYVPVSVEDEPEESGFYYVVFSDGSKGNDWFRKSDRIWLSSLKARPVKTHHWLKKVPVNLLSPNISQNVRKCDILGDGEIYSVEDIELLKSVYECYVKVLTDEIEGLFGLANAHGYKSANVNKGENARLQIKSALNYLKHKRETAISEKVPDGGGMGVEDDEAIVETIAGVLYKNKSDEADDGCWIEGKDFYKVAELITAALQSKTIK